MKASERVKMVKNWRRRVRERRWVFFWPRRVLMLAMMKSSDVVCTFATNHGEDYM